MRPSTPLLLVAVIVLLSTGVMMAHDQAEKLGQVNSL
jgi:hypothetical protein